MPETIDTTDIYRGRQERFEGEARGHESRARAASNLRLISFAALVIALAWPARTVAWTGVSYSAAAGVLILFFLMVVRQSAALRMAGRARRAAEVNRQSMARVARDWDALPDLSVEAALLDEHPYAEELDLFGRASLFQLVGPPDTVVGRRTLASWLLEPAEPGTIRGRQSAVEELAPRLELRQELAVRAGMAPPVGPEKLEAFFAWTEEAPWLTPQKRLVWSARILPIITTGLSAAALAAYLGITAWPAGALVRALFLFIIANFVLRHRQRDAIDGTLSRVFGRERSLSGFYEAFELLGREEFGSETLIALRGRLANDGATADAHMKRLEALLHRINSRESMFGGFLQALFLWDFHAVLWMERWKVDAGEDVRGWFQALGEFESLAGLAGLSYDNPHWTIPVIVDGGDAARAFSARELGHPLLAADVRVTNDVELGPPGSFTLVTGSNMSGKSTLLRAIGTNAALAQAGGPVCAKDFRLPPIELQAAMQAHDSLERGVSHFMAELQRLKGVVTAAEDAGASQGRLVLYLLDDILQGTNTAERQIAARKIISHLLRENAIGAVTSHDLELADVEELSKAARPVHFTERLEAGDEGPKLSFDYKLRPGIATSRNALKLLEIVGLDAPDVKPAER